MAVNRIFLIWAMLLSFVAGFNFYHNLVDSKKQSELEVTYAENKDRYESSIAEHEQFKSDISFLKGQVDALSKCTQPTK